MMPEPMPVVGMLNIDIPPVAMPSAVIVTTDSLAAATTFGRSASVMILAGTAFGWVDGAACGAGTKVGSGEIFDHSVMGEAPGGQLCGVVCTENANGLRTT